MQMGDHHPNNSNEAPLLEDDTLPGHRSHPRNAPSFMGQLGAAMKRQFVQKRRMPCSCCIEIFLPVIFILGLVAAGRAGGLEEFPSEMFIDPPPSTPNDYGPMIRNGVCYDTSKTTNPGDTISPLLTSYIRTCANLTAADPMVAMVLSCNTDTGINVTLPDGVSGFCVSKVMIATVLDALNNYTTARRLLTMNDFILLQWGTRIAFATRRTRLFTTQSPLQALLNSGRVYFTPSSEPTLTQLIAHLNATIQLFPLVYGGTFPDRETGEAFLTSVSGEGHAWGLVELVASTATELTVTLSMNKSSVPWPRNVRQRFSGGLGRQWYALYDASGFLALQSAINSWYAESVHGVPTSGVPSSSSSPGIGEFVAAPMPYAAYKNSVFLTIAGRLSPLVLVLSFLYSVSQLCKRLVEEKEQKLREGMMVMGLGKASFFLSWLLTYFIQGVITAVFITVLLKLGITKGSDPTLIFVVYLLFIASTISFATLLSTLFSKSRISALVAPIAYFMCSIPSFALPAGTSPGIKKGLSIFSPSAFAQATGLIFQYELTDGMGWKDVASPLDDYNMGTAMFFLAFDTVLYLFLTLYLDAVLPSEWGTKSNPCFCLLCCCTKKGEAEGEDVPRLGGGGTGRPGGLATGELFSPVSLGCNSKTEGKFIEAYPHQSDKDGFSGSPQAPSSSSLFQLGGSVHIKNLSKVFQIEGEDRVAVDHFDLRLFPDQVTVILGHNGAGKSTTMNCLTGMLPATRGDCIVYGHSVKHEIDAVRQDIGYCPQHNILWPNLTCNEHLEFYAALKGIPAAARAAEVSYFLHEVGLGDRGNYYSASLSGGQKRMLSVAIAFIGGSKLVLLDEPTAGMDVGIRRSTWELIRKMSKGRTTVLTTHFMDEADLLGNRIAIMTKGRLHSYGSPMFLKSRLGTGYVLTISEETNIQNVNEILSVIRQFIPDATVKEAKGQEASFSLPMHTVSQFPAVLSKLEAETRTLGITGMSMSVSTLEDVFLRIAEEEETAAALKSSSSPASPPHGGGSSPVKESHTTKRKHALDAAFNCTPQGGSFGRQVVGLLKKRFHNSRRDRRTLCLQVLLPIICLLLAMALAGAKPPDAGDMSLDLSMYGSTPNMISVAQCGNTANYFNPSYQSVENRGAVDSYNLSSYLLDTVKSHGATERYVGIVCDDSTMQRSAYPGEATPVPKTTVLLPNSSAIHSLPQALNEYYESTVRDATSNANINMIIRNKPLPWTLREKQNIDSFLTLIVGFFILIPFTFVPSTFVAFVVKERECKSKHLQFVSGVGPAAYWVSNFVFDLMSFLVTLVLTIIIFAAFKRDEYIGDGESFGATFLLFILYGLSGIAASYLVSFLFTNHSSAQNIVMMANFICGFALVITIFIFDQIESTKDAAKVLVWIFRIVPSYCLGEGILALALIPVSKQLGQQINALDLDQAGAGMIYMGVEVIVFMLLTYFLDHPSREKRKQQVWHNPHEKAPVIANEDADVTMERNIVEKGQRPGDIVTVTGLRKVYKGGYSNAKEKEAVRNLSFGVKKNEVFGFLGTNGAGKSTTMAILTAEFLPTNGVAKIGGFDVVQDTGTARQLIGFCPQGDALLDLLTAEEHIRLFAAIRGIPPAAVETVVDNLIIACGLEEHRQVKSKRLSGGNKRKLSVALALIGNPQAVFLDEPSAGMDPVARREMWDTILHVSTKSSIVLTTHHLEEVDVLAHRVAIMVGGEFKCIGNLNHLKTKFGGGYVINIKAKSESEINSAKSMLYHLFPNVVPVEERQLRLTFNLPIQSVSLSTLFQKLYQAQQSADSAIDDFTVQQSSLEQVFLAISGALVEETDDATAGTGSPRRGPGGAGGPGGGMMDGSAVTGDKLGEASQMRLGQSLAALGIGSASASGPTSFNPLQNESGIAAPTSIQQPQHRVSMTEMSGNQNINQHQHQHHQHQQSSPSPPQQHQQVNPETGLKRSVPKDVEELL